MPYDSSTGRIYIDTSTNPDTGVSIADVQTALGSLKNDIGQLITATNASNKPLVNKWAKFKPVRDSTLGLIDEERRILALHGLNIPTCGIVDYASKYNQEWTYNVPRGKGGGTLGYDEWYRIRDFEGYQKYTWQLGPVNERMVYTIFNGVFTIPSTTIGDLDTITFSMQCRENDDADPYLGLLYPYDFGGEGTPQLIPVSPYGLYDYYVGFAILDSSGDVWIYAGPHISDYFNTQGYHLYTGISAQIPDSMAAGACKIAPILAQHSTIRSGDTDPSWTSEFQGTFVTLNGAYLSANKVADANSFKTTINSVTIGVSSTTVSVKIKNQTGDLVTVNDMAGYILSNAAEDNEHDNGYSGPDYVAPGASGFINDMWPQNFQQGDVILSPYTYGGTWMVTTASNPSGMGAAYHNSLMAFRTANNNSTSIGNTNEVDFNIQVPYTEDSFGSYSNGLWLELCISLAGGSYFVRQINLSQYLTP